MEAFIAVMLAVIAICAVVILALLIWVGVSLADLERRVGDRLPNIDMNVRTNESYLQTCVFTLRDIRRSIEPKQPEDVCKHCKVRRVNDGKV
jgi:hypothetical protein